MDEDFYSFIQHYCTLRFKKRLIASGKLDYGIS